MLGDILAEFVAPEEANENGRAVAFDGTNLYLTKQLDAHIYRVSTAGALIDTIPTTVVSGVIDTDFVQKERRA